MKCPACGLYHPAFYERCVACGASFSSTLKENTPESQDLVNDSHQVDPKTSLARIRFYPTKNEESFTNERNIYLAKNPAISQRAVSILSMSKNKRGIFIALLILLLFAGATVFFLGRSPDGERLLTLGRRQLNLGQYAFAVQTLSKVTALRPNDPNAFLALARAYIGVDQLNEAWDCIIHAQQLGVGVVADPALASELANYYKQHGQYEKAIDLLRPLANAAVPGKRAELADLDALRGDDCIEKGKLDEAKRAWEEVQQLNEGSRCAEAKSRLSTIYLKLVDVAYTKGDDAKALDYLNKANALEESAKNYLLAADIYERDGKLKEAIEQAQKSLNLKSDDQAVKTRLAQLYMAQGKELIQTGNEDEGYGCIQQAGSLDPAFNFPAAIIKNLSVSLLDGKAKISGELWNPNNKNISALTMKVQLYNDATGQTFWQKEQHIIDEFVQPLAPKQTKSFAFSAPTPTQKAETLVFKIYLDENYYGEYPLKKGHKLASNKDSIVKEAADTKVNLEKQSNQESHNVDLKTSSDHKQLDDVELTLKQNKKSNNENEAKELISPEEKTMKDLEF